MKISKAPSISLGVLQDGEIIFTKSFGLRDIERGLEANSDTAYLIASCSKMFTSTALSLLDWEGKLSLKDTIRTHLPTFDPSGDPEIGKEATLVDALRHVTGLARANVVYMGPDGVISNTAEDHIAMVNALPTSNESGQRFRSWWYYTNDAFGLLPLVVEAVSNTTFAEFLKKRILEPLGLRQTLLFASDVENNGNIAYPYAPRSDGSWAKIESRITSENHSPILGAMGMRSSVNDMLGFFAAVLNRHDGEKDKNPRHPLLPGATLNPLGRITQLWKTWWTRPTNDGFENETAYTLGWFRTTLPTSAIGCQSINDYPDQYEPNNQVTLGRESEARTLYGHNGNANGSTAAAYLFPDSHAAVVAFSNASHDCDAAEAATRILIQALFNLKPHVDCVSALRKASARGRKKRADAVSEWVEHRDVSKYKSSPEDFLGSYIGLNTSRISLLRSHTASARLAVNFADDDAGICDLEPYNTDALSFFPTDNDSWMARAMRDWDSYVVGVFEFIRDENEEVVALWWQYEPTDWPSLWVRQKEGMSDEDVQRVIDKFGRHRKPTASKADASTADVGPYHFV